MKNNFIILSIAVGLIFISGFVVYTSVLSNPNLEHHGEIKPPMPDDNFQIQGIKWEWNAGESYRVGEDIGFTVSRTSKFCGDTFEAKIVNQDYSKVFWQESSPTQCESIQGGKLLKADFPVEKPIRLDAGLYVLRVESWWRGRNHIG
jgi:hypothetical protein